MIRIYKTWLEQTGLKYLEEFRGREQNLENVIDFLNSKGGTFTVPFMTEHGIEKVVKDLHDKIRELE